MEGSSSIQLPTTSSMAVDDDSNLLQNIWECAICMELPTDPVATSCGHVFCWPCLYRWLRNGSKPCPICRTHLDRDKNILSLYGHADGESPSNDSGKAVEAVASDNVIPPRPRNSLSFNTEASIASLDGLRNELPSMGAARQLVSELLNERGNMELLTIDLNQRNSNLRHEAMENDYRHFELTNQLSQKIAHLHQQLAQANHILASGSTR